MASKNKEIIDNFEAKLREDLDEFAENTELTLADLRIIEEAFSKILADVQRNADCNEWTPLTET